MYGSKIANKIHKRSSAIKKNTVVPSHRNKYSLYRI